MIKLAASLFVLIFLSGCPTAMWNKPSLVQNQPDTFKFTIYLGGLSGEETAFAKLQYELNNFENENDYVSYKIIDEKHNLFPAHKIDYTVHFIK